MPEEIIFKGVAFWTTATNGAGWKFTPATMKQDTIQKKAALGTGYWIKPAGTLSADHSLEVQWRTTDPAALKAAVETLATAALGTLVVPGWGSFPNCMLSIDGVWDPMKSDDATGYIVSNTLTFTQYP